MTDNQIKSGFDGQWQSENIEKHIRNCPSTQFYPIFEKYIKRGMKILDSGCGAGKWLFFYHRNGFDITGLDWSRKTVDKIKTYDKAVKAVEGDARKTNFTDNEFDVVISIGTTGYDIEGPGKALAENYRILKKDGKLIITVSVLTPTRMIIYFIKRAIQRVQSFLLKRKNSKYNTIDELLKKQGQRDCYLMPAKDKKGYYFFEYRYTLAAFASQLKKAGFEIIESRPMFEVEGVYHDLSPFSGKWDFEGGDAKLSLFAKIALRLFPRSFYHLALYVARKKG